MVVRFRRSILSALALASLACLATHAGAQQTLTVQPPPHHRPAHPPAQNGDIYVNKSGRGFLQGSIAGPESERNYFNDTKTPYYPLGPAFTANQGGYENLPSAREPFWPGF